VKRTKANQKYILLSVCVLEFLFRLFLFRVKILDVNFIFKIAAIGIIVSVLNTLLIRSGRDDQAMLTTLAGVIVVLMMLVPQISDLFESVRKLFDL
jgi:stage III sporulation protein AC